MWACVLAFEDRTMTTATRQRQATNEIVRIDLNHITQVERQKLGRSFCAFLDASATATGRATHYNTKKEQEDATRQIHRDLFKIDRGIYGMSLLLPVTDYTRQMGLGFLLDNPFDQSVLTEEQEGKVIGWLASEMLSNAPQRVFKMFANFRKNRVNNSRTRKLILRSILNAERLELWAVKYRMKLKASFEHAWGIRKGGIMRSILGKRRTNAKEKKIVRQHIDKYVLDKDTLTQVHECVSFILGDETALSLPLLKAYAASKQDLSKGRNIPMEVLYGIRSTYHKDAEKKTVLELTKAKMTATQKMQVQRVAKEEKVEVEFDPSKINDPVKLYIYALNQGLDRKVQTALDRLAKKAAQGLVVQYEHVGIVVDSSESMTGHGTQALRPVAVAMATRDMLVAKADRSTIEYAGADPEASGLVRPEGSTELASALVKVLKADPDCVFIFSDGYENAPAGRLAETVKVVRDLGVETPIFQINPVLAAESGASRQLSPQVPVMPLSSPKAISIPLIKSLFEGDLERGIASLARSALPAVGLEVE